MTTRSYHRTGSLLSLVPLLLLLIASCGNNAASPPASEVAPGESSAAPIVGLSLAVPSIGARSSLIPLALNPDKTIQAPPLSTPAQAGLYSKGPLPGDPGPAVILGHINGGGTPGVFAKLAVIKQGDEINVTRADGRTATFTVYRTLIAKKSEFPTSQVYSDTPTPEVRLISCGGALNPQEHTYLSNIIVFARET